MGRGEDLPPTGSSFRSATRQELSLQQLRILWNPLEWPEASLFCVLARSVYCQIELEKYAPTPMPPCAILPGAATVRDAHEWDRLEAALGADRSSGPRRLGWLGGAAVDPGIWSPVLRSCPECLKAGYHATLYQHTAFERCPLHGVALTSACRHCGEACAPSLRETLRLGFRCPACRRMLINEPLVLSGALVEQADRRVQTLRPKILSALPGRVEQCRLPGPTVGPSIVAARTSARFTIWVQGPPFRSFPEEVLRLSMEQEHVLRRKEPMYVTSPREADRHAQGAAFRWVLNGLDPRLQAETIDLAARTHGQQPGARLRGEQSVLATSIVKAAHLLGMTRCLISGCDSSMQESGGDPGAHSALSFSRSPWRQVSRRLLALEVFGLTACCLLQAARTRWLIDFSWSEMTAPTTWAPAWRIERVRGAAIARIRPRIDETGILRLFRRYLSQRLQGD